MSSPDDTLDSAPDGLPGRPIIVGNVIGTAVFVVTAVAAAAFFTTTFQWIGAITALTLFAIGVFTFIWSYFHAVNRSRTEEIGTAQLYLLTGPPSPPAVKRVMLTLLSVQAVTALVTTLVRPNGPDGKPGSSLAVGFLVAMLGFGLNGLWCAFHGEFPPRRLRSDRTDDDDQGAATPAEATNGSPDRPE